MGRSPPPSPLHTHRSPPRPPRPAAASDVPRVGLRGAARGARPAAGWVRPDGCPGTAGPGRGGAPGRAGRRGSRLSLRGGSSGAGPARGAFAEWEGPWTRALAEGSFRLLRRGGAGGRQAHPRCSAGLLGGSAGLAREVETRASRPTLDPRPGPPAGSSGRVPRVRAKSDPRQSPGRKHCSPAPLTKWVFERRQSKLKRFSI